MRFHHFELLNSTNDTAKQFARLSSSVDLSEGFSVRATRQNKGRGSHGRFWYSGSSGGLYFSVVFSPNDLFSHKTEVPFSVQVGQKIVDFFHAQYQIPVSLKHPNDILFGSHKVGGVLVESVSDASTETPKYIIIGVGLNLNQKRFPSYLVPIAISLWQITKIRYDIDTVFQLLTKELYDGFARH